jgi:DNA mismatch repair protein MutL
MKTTPTSARIRRLAPQVANQIAAGEVVERPASVAKELLENSLDAGARRIEVDAEQGGVKLLRVRDDGGGIHPEDLGLALSPHATSKIASHEDLLGISSLGFRGEALASIASVSRFSLISRSADQDSGWQLTAEAAPAPAPHPPGTTVEVRDLFYNVPARRKFLRAERTEFIHLEEVVKRVALSRFDLAVNFRHNGRSVLNLPPADDPSGTQRRLRSVVGGQFAAQALAVELEAAGLHLRGWLGGPGYSRSQADLQFFFLNGRMIRDKLVNHAIRQACSGFLEPGRYSAYVLYLEMDPRQVDVNVHPTKHEVRFRESRLVHDFLHRAALQALDQGAAPAEIAEPVQVSGPDRRPASTERGPDSAPASASFPEGPGQPLRRPLFPARQAGSVRETVQAYGVLSGASARKDASTYLGIIDGRYVLGRNPDGFVLVDGLGHERARLCRHLKQALDNGGIASRTLLVPAAVQLQPEGDEPVERALPYGVEIERLGPENGVLRRLPGVMKSDAGAAPLALQLLEHLRRSAPQSEIVELLACSAAGTLDPETGKRLLAAVAEGGIEPGHWRLLDGAAVGRLFGEPLR